MVSHSDTLMKSGRLDLNLRARLALLVTGVVTTVVAVLTAIFVYSLSTNLDEASASKSQAMQDALKRKGVAVARNVALTSSRAILTGNFSFLLEVVTSAVSNDREVVYAIIMDKERRALVHSNAALAGTVLENPEAVFAAKQTDVGTQSTRMGDQEILEVVAPITVADQVWGVARFGLTLATVRAEIRQSEALAQTRIALAVAFCLAAALLLLVVAAGFGVQTARVLMRPMSNLIDGAKRLQEGDMDQRVAPQGSQEFRILARAFNEMTDAVRTRETAMQSALAQAQEANRLKSEFLANVSHELRTPLNAIINVPPALCRDYDTQLLWHCNSCNSDYEPDPDSQGEAKVEPCPNCSASMKLETRAFYHGDPTRHYHFLQRTLQSAQHLLSVVTDILDFSKLEAGKMTVHAETMSVAHMVADISETVAPLAEAKAIAVVWPELAPDVKIWSDPIKISQVILNLVGNAVKFTPENGKIEVVFTPGNGPAPMDQFMVRDSGMGIPSDKLNQLFESFRQVDGSHTRAHGGTGLGLAISRKLVELGGGRIWVESELGQGSSFYFTVPRDQPIAAPVAIDGRRYTGRVLVVDDDRVQLELVERILTEVGYQVECISDPTNLPDTLSKHAFDVMIVDVMMPGMSGLTVLKNIKTTAATKLTPVIVSTAYHMNRDLVEGLGGVWLPKPWVQEQLIACIDANNHRTGQTPAQEATHS